MDHKQRQSIRMKSEILSLAYDAALEYMNEKTWKACCEIAINQAREGHNDLVTSVDTVAHWNRLYRGLGAFPNPELDKPKESTEPPVFELFPLEQNRFREYCETNIECIE